jgi:Phage tail protein (Tail_P2_I)
VNETVYRLLPAVHRLRDAECGFPLRTLLAAVADQQDELAAEIRQLYDDWFIETCRPEVVPAFADLLGVVLDPSAGEHADRELDRARVGRAALDRRAKGTLTAIEDIAVQASGWPVRAVEAERQESSLPSIRFAGTTDVRLVDVRGQAVQWRDPFGNVTRLPDVRRVDSARTPGHGGPQSVIVWVWRLREDPAVGVRARRVGARHFTVDPLGADTALAVIPQRRHSGAPPIDDLDVPAPLRLAAVAEEPADYIGPARSIQVTLDGDPVPLRRLVVGDLRRWRFDDPDRICLDPERGRVVVGRHLLADADEPPEVRVSSATLTVGGVGADHLGAPAPGHPALRYSVGEDGGAPHATVSAALAAWRQDREGDVAGPAVTIEIVDNGCYVDSPEIFLAPGEMVSVCAAAGMRPVLVAAETARPRTDVVELEERLVVERVSETDERSEVEITGPGGTVEQVLEVERQFDVERVEMDVEVEVDKVPSHGRIKVHGRAADREAGPAAPAPEVTFDGIYLAQPVEISGTLGRIRFLRCTMMPVDPIRRSEYDPPGPDRSRAAIELRSWTSALEFAKSISGPVVVTHPEAGHDPTPVTLEDTILDAGGAEARAFSGQRRRAALVSLSAARSTVLGRVDVRAVETVRDSIVTGPVGVEQRQRGRVECSWIRPGSTTPLRDRCQPETAVQETGADPAAWEMYAPRFDSSRFGDPAYGRLAADVAPAVGKGAADGGELGAFHDAWQQRRLDAMSRRVAEFAPAGVDIAVHLAT